MKYLVTMELIGTAAASPQELVQHLEQLVIPSHETLMKLEAERRILAGGFMVGARATTFIVDVASNEELDQLLLDFPGWGLMKVDVIPLQSFEGRTAQARQLLERLKATL